MSHSQNTVIVRQLGMQEYAPVWKAMQHFTQTRQDEQADELWILQHPPVFTLGLNGKQEHVINTGDIPLVEIDRGGQVTYHGPGQIVIYTLVNLKRQGIGIRELVSIIEQSVIDLLADHHIDAVARPDAPGVYVDGAKIAALGLRVKRGNTYHGLAMNIDMELEPFSRINPCGYEGMPVTQARYLGINDSIDALGEQLLKHLINKLGYNNAIQTQDPIGTRHD